MAKQKHNCSYQCVCVAITKFTKHLKNLNCFSNGKLKILGEDWTNKTGRLKQKHVSRGPTSLYFKISKVRKLFTTKKISPTITVSGEHNYNFEINK